MKRNDDGKLCFPRLECPEIPFYGQKVCECISERFKKMCGTKYELILLYSTINDHFNDHIRPIFSAFHCLSPNENDTGMPVAPACKQYEWMTACEVEKQVNMIGEENCCWINSLKDYESFFFMMRDSEYKRHEDEYGVRPWEVPGWFTNTSNAASDVLARLGYELEGKFEQFSITHGTAAVLRANTNKGRVYLKSSNGIEEHVTSLVAGFAPHLVRKPLFVSDENRWMLLNDQGKPVDEDTELEDFAKLLIEHGKLQLQSLHHIEALKDVGLRVETSGSMIRQAKSLLSDKRVLEKLGRLQVFQTYDGEDFPDIELHSIALYQLLQELYDNGKCPLVLVHGDITGNVLKSEDGGLVLFDWGAARIDIPLSDTFCFLRSVTPQIMDEYLRLWEKYAPLSDLRKLLEIVPIQGSLVCLFSVFDGEEWILSEENIQILASLLVDAKTLVEKRNL